MNLPMNLVRLVLTDGVVVHMNAQYIVCIKPSERKVIVATGDSTATMVVTERNMKDICMQLCIAEIDMEVKKNG